MGDETASRKMGRRERKKAETRRALSEAAARLFLERGFEEVTVAEVAEEADTAVTTLFNHFPDGKVALLFDGEESDRGEDRAAALVAAVRHRPAGCDVLMAVESFIGSRGPFKTRAGAGYRRRVRLIRETPALRAYARRMWTDCEDALTAVLAEETGRGADAALRALARFALEIPDLAGQEPDAREALAEVFARLRRGWPLDDEGEAR